MIGIFYNKKTHVIIKQIQKKFLYPHEVGAGIWLVFFLIKNKIHNKDNTKKTPTQLFFGAGISLEKKINQK